MTPPPAASHADQTPAVALSRPASNSPARAIGQLLDAHSWSQMRLLVDIIVLYLAASAALFAAPAITGTGAGWLAAAFPLLTVAIVRARRSPDDRLHSSPLDTASHVVGVVSLSAVLTIAAGSVLGGAHPVALALRLWLFSVVYLCLARIVFQSVRSQAVSNPALATPTLIVGAGTVGDHLVTRLTGDPSYGLRPVGFLDSDPLQRSTTPDGHVVPVLGGPNDLAAAVRQTGTRHTTRKRAARSPSPRVRAAVARGRRLRQPPAARSRSRGSTWSCS
jgi:FlaA1/EpsC-like NDP-sugar epimerase